MKKDRLKLLNKIGSKWRIEKNDGYLRDDETWNAMFQRLVQFKEEHGHVNVLTTGEDKDLGVWLSAQRLTHRRNRLEKTRARKLRTLGVSFKNKNNTKYGHGHADDDTSSDDNEDSEDGGSEAQQESDVEEDEDEEDVKEEEDFDINEHDEESDEESWNSDLLDDDEEEEEDDDESSDEYEEVETSDEQDGASVVFGPSFVEEIEVV